MQPLSLLLLTLAASPFVLAVPRNPHSHVKWGPWGGYQPSTTTTTVTTTLETAIIRSTTITRSSTIAKSITVTRSSTIASPITIASSSTIARSKTNSRSETTASSSTTAISNTIATSTHSTAVTTPVVASSSTAAISPSSSSPPSASSDCSAYLGQDALLFSGPFTINNNLWGMASGSGSQCLNSVSGGDPVAWSTTWSWENIAADASTETYIKSYANAYNPSIKCQALSDYTTIPTTWTWSYDVSQTDVMADVAYDAFLGGSECVLPGPTYPIEVMIWLGAYGGLGTYTSLSTAICANAFFTAAPIGAFENGSPASPMGSLISDGITFNLFSGKNTGTGSTVYSFVVGDGSLKNSYTGDLLPFFTFLQKFEIGLSAMLLQSIQAGTEAVNGSATFSTSSYTISSS